MKSKLKNIKKLKDEFSEVTNILNKIQKEHEKVLLEQKNELTLQNQNQIAQLYTPEINRIQSEIQGLETAISSKEKETNDLYNHFIFL